MRKPNENYKGTGMTRAALADRLGISPASLLNSKYTPEKLQALLQQRPFKPDLPELPPSAVYDFLASYACENETRIPARELHRYFVKYCRENNFAMTNYRSGLRAAGVTYRRGYYYLHDFWKLYKRDVFFDVVVPEQEYKNRPSYRDDFLEYVGSLEAGGSYTQPVFWGGWKSWCHERGLKPIPRDRLHLWYEWKLYYIGKERKIYIYVPA